MKKLANKYSIVFKIENTDVSVSWAEASLKTGYGELDTIFGFSNKTLEDFLSESEMQRAVEIGYRNALERTKTEQTFQEITEQLKIVRAFFKELDELDFRTLKNTEFKVLLMKYDEIISEFYRYFSYSEFIYFEKIEDELYRQIFEQVNNDVKSKEILNTLLTPTKTANILSEELLERYKLIQKVLENSSQKSSLINSHLDKFDFIPYANGQKSYDEKSFEIEINKLFEKPLDKLIEEIEEEDRQIESDKNEALKLIKLNMEMENLIYAVLRWQEIKWLMRVYLNRTFVGRDSIEFVLYRELKKRTKLKWKQLDRMFMEEFLKALDGQKINLTEINQRVGPYVGYKENGEVKFIFGDDAQSLIDEIHQKTEGYHEKPKELNGKTACLGYAKGIANVFLGFGSSSEFSKKIKTMKKGQILVAESTGPEFMPAIYKALAIVTNEGGITSHAAIVSRELKIPCIVGTKFATQVIKTGDLIEVNADKGIVRILN